jgi:hypothetical protein
VTFILTLPYFFLYFKSKLKLFVLQFALPPISLRTTHKEAAKIVFFCLFRLALLEVPAACG